jgi:hypothetical protein
MQFWTSFSSTQPWRRRAEDREERVEQAAAFGLILRGLTLPGRAGKLATLRWRDVQAFRLDGIPLPAVSEKLWP